MDIKEKFLSDLKLGKPIGKKKRKPLSENTIQKYRNYLGLIESEMGALTHLNEDKVDEFRRRLASDEVKRSNGSPFKDSVKSDTEYKLLGLFLKWAGRPELFTYMDNYNSAEEVKTITQDEANLMISDAPHLFKAVIAVLFDSGFRAGEFLSLRYCDFDMECRRSKGYYKVRCPQSKTRTRTIGLFINNTTEVLDLFFSYNKDKVGTKTLFFDKSRGCLNQTIRRIGERVLKRKIYPHVLRHSSATYYCHQMTQYQLCKRYGWSLSSDMPRTYIEREGIEEESVGEQIQNDQVNRYREELNKVKERNDILEEQQKEMNEELRQIKRLLNIWQDAELRKSAPG